MVDFQELYQIELPFGPGGLGAPARPNVPGNPP